MQMEQRDILFQNWKVCRLCKKTNGKCNLVDAVCGSDNDRCNDALEMYLDEQIEEETDDA